MSDETANPGNNFDDGLGGDVIDEGGGKLTGPGGGGGSDIDPSYEDALRILDRAFMIPSPFEQRALIMDDGEGAELARCLTRLRGLAGGGAGMLGIISNVTPNAGALSGAAVDAFIAALQEQPADAEKLARMQSELANSSQEAQATLEQMRAFPGVQAKFDAP